MCNYRGVESPESCFDIVAREPVVRGQVSSRKEKLRVVARADGVDHELTVFLKRTSAAEVVALRAAGQVPGATAIPRLIRSGRDCEGDWIAIPFYAGKPAPTETDVPDNIVDSLAAVHAHYLNGTRPAAIPARDADWWRGRCAQPRFRRLDRPFVQPIVERLDSWSSHGPILEALGELPRTLLHGDVHRNNVIIDEDDVGHLIDWGGASHGIPQFDLITPGPPGSRGYERYVATWRMLTGESTASSTWRRGYLTATICTKVDYLGFAARMFGDDAATKMFDTAVRALIELERMS